MNTTNEGEKSRAWREAAYRTRAEAAENPEQRAKRYRRRILELSQAVQAMHIAPAFSCLEIVDVIYHQLLPISPAGSIFIMSKGHGVMSQYVVLEDLGILPKQQLSKYCTPTGIVGAHPDRGTPGIVASTGSLGHGLGMAVGYAYAERLKVLEAWSNPDRPLLPGEGVEYPSEPAEPAKVYCLISDGELQEGSTWEAIAMAAHLSLSNLVVFVDYNDFGGLARMSEGFPAFYPIDTKVRAFGWDVVGHTLDGHLHEDIFHSAVHGGATDGPLMLVCHTVKGKGVSFMEGVPIWHYRSPNAEEYARAMEELR